MRNYWLPSRRDLFVFSVFFGILFLAYRYGIFLRALDILPLPGNPSVSSFFSSLDNYMSEVVLERVRINQREGILAQGMGIPWTHVGLLPWIMTLPPTVLNLHDQATLEVLLIEAATFNALIVALGLVVIRNILGLTAALLGLLGALQPYASVAAHSIWILPCTRLVPALCLAMLLARRSERRPIAIFLATFVGSLFAFGSFFDYATIPLCTSLGVLTYFALRDRWNVRKLILSSVAVIVSLAAGLGLALVAQGAQFLVRNSSSYGDAIAFVSQNVFKWSGNRVGDVYVGAIKDQPWIVLQQYLAMEVLGAPATLPLVSLFSVAALVLILLFALGTALVASNLAPTDRWVALACAWLVALLGPLTWFTLAWAHSWVHTGINEFLWFLPTIPLGLALLWMPVHSMLTRSRQDPPFMFILGFTFFTVIAVTLVGLLL